MPAGVTWWTSFGDGIAVLVTAVVDVGAVRVVLQQTWRPNDPRPGQGMKSTSVPTLIAVWRSLTGPSAR